jgi:hypothetical protein
LNILNFVSSQKNGQVYDAQNEDDQLILIIKLEILSWDKVALDQKRQRKMKEVLQMNK